MTYIYGFLFVGTLCMIAQIILDKTKFTPGHITSLFVVIGAFLEFGGIYDFFIKHVGPAASLPITSFGHLIAQGCIESSKENGVLGLFTGVFTYTSAGIAATLIFSFILSQIFNAKK